MLNISEIVMQLLGNLVWFLKIKLENFFIQQTFSDCLYY